MPELPEVETVVRWLEPTVVGTTCTKVVQHQESLRFPFANDLQNIVGKTILATRRRAKWPGFVTNDGVLWTHLGMTGQLTWVDAATPLNEHDHFDLYFSSGEILRYHDPRRFGIVAWTPGQESDPPTSTLGPEPLEDSFDGALLKKGLSRTSKAIKVALMDGKAVAGVGNIYASEALWRSKIHPDAPAKKLTVAQYNTLADAIKKVLRMSLENGGSTLRDYRRPDGSSGQSQLYHAVYNRTNLPCLVCKKPIASAMHAGRATYWCKTCQPWSSKWISD
jgi:formamidopyrimidine-DNA glycosylase